MTEAILIASMLVLFRVTAFIAFMPPRNGGIAPATVRLGLAVAMTVLLVPQYAGPAAIALLAGGHSGTGFWVQLAFLTARETAFGAGLAWLFSLTLVPIRVAGAWVAQEMGLTMASLTSPTDHQPSNVVSQSLEAVGVLMFFTLDLHHTV
ncbi:MAG: flagellar biosynthetic protein FliR, partial [Planctomycetaceae bacterium]|nr:flagellar biosynthetic protein FliR [Planctomycetaceae bacterium]